MVSTTSRGNYYKRKTKGYYESLGYIVQFTEFTCGIKVPGRILYRKIDIFGSDGISMNGKEIIFWNSKATTEDRKDGISKMRSEARLKFAQYPFPKSVKLQVVIWLPRKKPIVEDLMI